MRGAQTTASEVNRRALARGVHGGLGAGPLAGGGRGSAPLPKKILYFAS